MRPDHLIGLAAEIEKEGQYNAAKLLRAASSSLTTRASTEGIVPTDPSAQAEALERIAEQLGGSAAQALERPLRAAADALRASTVALDADAPDPYVCRICGLVRLEPFVERCEHCGRWPSTAERVRPIYWIEASTPPEATEMLRATPELIRSLLASGNPMAPAQDGGWSAHQTIEHLHNAQAVFRGRIDQLVVGGDPHLESVMVWTMDSEEVSTEELFDAYLQLRAEIVDLLDAVPPYAWWNTGRHEEFGAVTLAEQASYFANHEPTHLGQIADAVG